MKKRSCIPVAVLALLCAAMMSIPGVNPIVRDAGVIKTAKVTEVDDSLVVKTGLLEYGTQRLKVKLPDESLRSAANELRAQLDLDKKFAPGDVALVSEDEEPLVARDHFRLGWMAALFILFSALLLCFAGWTGLKALFSFLFCCLAVWKVLIPLTLSGISASWIVFGTVLLLTGVIMYLVAGATRVGISAFLGSMLGIGISLIMAHLCVAALKVNGATMPFSQALLYSGYESLDLSDIFVGAIILASSGAVMDLAMDIATGMGEVYRHNPTLSFGQLFSSGLSIGRAVVGTMTTTLLLAYSGGYLTMLMAFAAQGTPPAVFLNSTLVSAEVVKTLVGSFGLVSVAPFTALASSWIIRK